jgi:hypothetical protein
MVIKSDPLLAKPESGNDGYSPIYILYWQCKIISACTSTLRVKLEQIPWTTELYRPRKRKATHFEAPPHRPVWFSQNEMATWLS